MKHRGWRRLCKLGGTALRRATARLSDQAGQSLVEAVIALMIFLIAGTGMIDVLTSSTNAHGYAQATSLSEEAAQTAIEQIRDLNYTNIGLVDGNPAGTWVATKTAASLGFPNLGASIVTKIKYVGDGITGGYNQLTDYKQVTVSVVSSATGQQLAQAETFVAPPTQADQGNASQAAMVISVIDSINGLPVSGVPIELANGPSSPLNDVTDSTGSVTFAGLTYNPTSGSTEYYDIDPTYPSGYALDPNVTQASLAQNLSPGATGGGTLQVYQEMTFDVTITDGGSPYGGSASVLVTQSGSSKCTSSQSYTITGGSGTIPNQYPGCTYTLTPSATGLDGHAVTLNVQNDYPTSSSSGNLSPAFALTLSTPPSATSINLVGSSPTNASSVSWTTTFNEPVTGVSASNFSLAASNVSGASITSVTPVSPVGGYATTYTITASTGTGNSSAGSPGTLGLNLSTIAGITDSSGDSLTGTATGQVYTIQVVAPTVSNVSSTLADGSYTTGQLVPITVTFPEAVNVTGTPQLQLATAGSTNEQASYASGSGTSTLTFNYTVAAGDATSDLDYLATNSLALNGGTIIDSAGNSANLTLPALTGAGSLSTNKNIVIDTTPPHVNAIALTGTSPTNAASVSWTVTFSHPVTGVATSNFSLAPVTVTGATITGLSGSGSSYTVTANTGSGSGSLGLNLSSITGIHDSAGTGLTGTFTGAVYTIQKTAPTVTNVTSTLANGSYTVGQLVPITVTFAEAVNVTGTPELQLATAGTTNEQATYASGSGTTTLTFNYTVVAGDTSSDLDYLATTSLTLNGGTIIDGAGNNATLTLPALTGAGSLSTNKNIIIDTTAPVVTLAAPTNSSYVTTTTPTLSGTAGNATGDNTFVVVTIYNGPSILGTVNQTLTPTRSGTTWSTTATTLAQGTYTAWVAQEDAAGNIGTSNINTFTVDSTTPTISNVTSTLANGTYGTGQVVPVTVTFSEPVTVTGTPEIALNTTPTSRYATYASGSGTSTLTFNYTVQSTDTSADLNYVATTSLTLNGGTIKSLGGTAATLTLPAPAGAGSLGTNDNIAIAPPAASSITTAPSPQDGKPDNSDVITLTYNEAMSANSIMSSWTGSSTTVNAVFTHGTTTSLVIKTTGGTTLNLGTITLGDTSTPYVSSGSKTDTASISMTTNASNQSVVTVTLTSNAGMTAHTAATVLTWTPVAAATNTGGTASSTTAVTSSSKENF